MIEIHICDENLVVTKLKKSWSLAGLSSDSAGAIALLEIKFQVEV